MIKFFRKIRQNLLMKNKAGKYFKYAVGEIVLVVIGILIALQINNWNNQRQLNTQEQVNLKILKSEFTFNKIELQRNIEKAKRLKGRADSLLILFKVPQSNINPENLKLLTLGLSAYSTYDPSNGALNNLISSGQLNLIRNDSLRIILSKWFGEVQDVKEDEVRIMNYGDTYLEPIKLKFLNYHSASLFHRNSVALLENPEFENIVARMLRGVAYIIKNYESLDLEIENILKLIDQEIFSAKPRNYS